MKKRVISLILAVCLLAALFCGCQKSNVAAESRNGVARVLVMFYCDIYIVDPDTMESALYLEDYNLGYSLGTGFGVGHVGKPTEYFVTNRHVVDDNDIEDSVVGKDPDYGLPLVADKPTIKVYILKDDYAFDSTTGLDTSRVVPCDIIYQAPSDKPDLAILQAAEEVEGRVALPLQAENEEVESGDTVYALGYPGTTDQPTMDIATGNQQFAGSVEKVTITNGIVSLINTIKDEDATVRIIQHTAQVNHGNSGGPLLDEHGAVVGVNTFIYGQNISTGDTMTNGSIKIEYVRDLLDEYKIYWEPLHTTNFLLIGLIVLAVLAAAGVAVYILVLRPRQAPAVVPAPQPSPYQPSYQPSPAPVTPSAAPPAHIPGDSGYRIQGITGSFAGRRFAIAGQLRIGRDPNRNDLVYPDVPGVSGVHCAVMVNNGQVILVDLGSSYGTFVDGKRLAANAPMVLKEGQRFCLGNDTQVFEIAKKAGM